MQPQVNKRLIRSIAHIDQAIPDSSRGMKRLYNNFNRVLELLLADQKDDAMIELRTFKRRLSRPPKDVKKSVVAMFKNETVPLVETLIEGSD